MIKIYTDSEGIKETTNQLLTELNYYTGCLEAVKQIANKDDIISLNELEADILKGTNFKDVNKVAELRGCYDAYKFFKDYHNKYDLNNYTESLKIKKEVLDQLEQAHTSYLNKDAEMIYRKLDKCTEILNSINRAYSNCLKADYNGNWSINVLALQTINNELSKQV